MNADNPPTQSWSTFISSCSRLIRVALVGAGHAPGSATFRVLGMLARNDGMHVGDIARGENATQATASNLVARLKREGLATTGPDPVDGRATLVSITPDGRHVLEELFRGLDETMDEYTADLTEEEVAALYKALPVMNKITEGRLK